MFPSLILSAQIYKSQAVISLTGQENREQKAENVYALKKAL